jgi:Do/DeqQ family serine protease
MLGAAALLLCGNALGAALPVAVDGEPLPSLAPMLERVTPAVVNISSQARVRTRGSGDPYWDFFLGLQRAPREHITQSLGSGVIVDAKQGFVLTNHHVIAGGQEIAVTLRDGRSLEAEVVGTDEDTDLAVIRIPAEGLSELPLADSDALRVGDFVVAVGNPFGLGQTVTSGIVSALGRSGLGIETYENFIQTDASINQGNSGGALVDLNGHLVGINTAIFSPSGGNVGIGFAIPANMARLVLTQLIESGEVHRGTVGFDHQDLDSELAAAFGIEQAAGVVVTRVYDSTPAAEAGLQVGDVITAVNSRPIRNSQQLRNAIGLLQVGDEVAVDLIRDGKRERLKTVVAESSVVQLDGGNLHPRLAGAVFGDAATAYRDNRLRGVIILQIEYSSVAWRYGLRAGDIILSMQRRNTEDLQQFADVVENAGPDLLVRFVRGRQAYFLALD